MPTTTERSTATRLTPKTDPTARTEMPVQPPGEVERREQSDSSDKNQRPVMPPHTEAMVAPSAYVDRDRIASLAYSYWLERQGRDGGSADEDWRRAEAMLRDAASRR